MSHQEWVSMGAYIACIVVLAITARYPYRKKR